MSRVVVNVFVEHLQDFDGGAQFGGGGCHHKTDGLRRISGFGSRNMDWFVFMPASEPPFTGCFVPKGNKMKPAFCHAVSRGHGQDAIQLEERKGIL
jgi:hypothetical protein